MNLDQLEQLAAAATPGPWKKDAEYVVAEVPTGRPGGEVIIQCRPTVHGLGYKPHSVIDRALIPAPEILPMRANAAFVAAADPRTILALIAVARAAPDALESLTLIDESLNGEHDICDMCVARGPLREALAALEAL